MDKTAIVTKAIEIKVPVNPTATKIALDVVQRLPTNEGRKEFNQIGGLMSNYRYRQTC